MKIVKKKTKLKSFKCCEYRYGGKFVVQAVDLEDARTQATMYGGYVINDLIK